MSLSPDAHTVRPPRTLSRVARITLGASLIVVACLVAYAGSTPVLIAVGEQLVHSDPVEHADAMIVLASGVDRIIEAADVYKGGFVPLVVLTREAADPADEFLRSLGMEIESSEEKRKRVLNALGVPPDAVIVLEELVGSTVDEARAFARWVKGRRIRVVMIVTSPSHTARARLTFLRALRDSEVRVVVHPSKLARFRADTWWQSRDTLREGLYEWQKLLYYWLFELRNLEPAAPPS